MSRREELLEILRNDLKLWKDSISDDDNSKTKCNKQIKKLPDPKEMLSDTQTVTTERKTPKEVVKPAEMFAKPKLCFYEDDASSVENEVTKKSSNSSINVAAQKPDISKTDDKLEWTKKTEAFLMRIQNKPFPGQSGKGNLSETDKSKSSDANQNKRKDYPRSSDRPESPPCKRSTSDLVSSSTVSQVSDSKSKLKCDLKLAETLKNTLQNLGKERVRLEKKVSEKSDKVNEKAISQELNNMKTQMSDLWKALGKKEEESQETRKHTAKNEKLKQKDMKEPMQSCAASDAEPKASNTPKPKAAKEKYNPVENAMSEGIKTATSLYLKAKNFYDGGNLWCQTCNTLHIDIHEVSHHKYSHYRDEEADNKDQKSILDKSTIQPDSAPARGDEFIELTHRCKLCDCFLDDSFALKKHFTSQEHNAKFKEFLAANPDYEASYLAQKMVVLLRKELPRRSFGDKLVNKIIID